MRQVGKSKIDSRLRSDSVSTAKQTLLNAIIAGAHPMAKCIPIEVVGYGATAKYPRMERRRFITVDRPRMRVIGTAVP